MPFFFLYFDDDEDHPKSKAFRLYPIIIRIHKQWPRRLWLVSPLFEDYFKKLLGWFLCYVELILFAKI
jgi:hypothetical protein